MNVQTVMDRLRAWRQGRLIHRREPGALSVMRALGGSIPDHVSWGHTLGVLAIFLFAVQVATGVMLALYYQPSVEMARESLEFITAEVTFGWLVRSVHHYAGELLLVVVGLHLLRVILSRAYRNPRQLTWILGVILLMCALAFRFTGHALPMDQVSYWAAVDESQVVARIPLVGGLLRSLMYGGSGVSSQSLGRFYALHTLILPWLTFVLMLLHLYLVRKHGFAPPRAKRND